MIEPKEGQQTEAAEGEASEKDAAAEGEEQSTSTAIAEGEEQAEGTEAAEKSSSSEEQGEEKDDLEEFLKDGKKDNVQRRIDQLTAKVKTLEEENARIKGEKKPEGEVEYSEAQLRAATKKAIEDGDADLLSDIFDYRVKKMQKELVKKYEDAESAKSNRTQQIVQEWDRVVNDYGTVWADEKGKEIYPGAKTELNIADGNSLFYRLALNFYNSVDEHGNKIYNKDGGQRLAVADALGAILRKKRIAPQGRMKQLERTLAKEKRKKSLAGEGAQEAEVESGKPKSNSETLSEYIAERKKMQNAQIGA